MSGPRADTDIPQGFRASSSKKKRRLIEISLIVLAPFLLLVGGSLFSNYRSNQRLRDVIAAIEKDDPHWRLADLEEHRNIPDEAENSAPRVLAVATRISGNWPVKGSPIEDPDGNRLKLVNAAIERVAPYRLSDEMAEALKTELNGFGPALADARRLKDFPQGGTKIVWDDVPFLTLIPQVQETRKVSRLLQADALSRAQEGDLVAAFESIRANLNVARSLGDEPLLISMLVRIAVDGITLSSVERTLSLGEAPAAPLEELQRLLTQEEAEPLLYTGLRGERAAYHDMIEKLRNGTVPRSTLGTLGMPNMPMYLAPGWMFRTSQTLGLEALNEGVKAAKGPPERLLETYQAIDQRAAKTPRWRAPFYFLFVPATNAASLAHVRSRTHLRCTIVMLAAERYRLDHGDWPKTLDALVPDYLESVPRDPFGSGPLRMLRRDDGLTIYSVSDDGNDDGARDLDVKNWRKPGNDLGTRLWDLKSRRQEMPVNRSAAVEPGAEPGTPLETPNEEH